RTRRIIGRYGVVLLYPDEERWARDTMLMSMPTASLCTVPFDLLARARSRWHGSVRLWWQCDRLRFCMVLCYYILLHSSVLARGRICLTSSPASPICGAGSLALGRGCGPGSGVLAGVVPWLELGEHQHR